MRNRFMADFLIGFSDGLVIPFALAAALSGGGVQPFLVLTIVLAVIVAGAIFLAYSAYQAGQPEKVHKTETPEFLASLGLSAEMQKKALADIAHDREELEKFLEENEYQAPENPAESAMIIGLSYLLGGVTALIPYFFAAAATAFRWSAIVVILLLFLTGFLKGQLSGRKPWAVAGKLALMGTLAGAAAFFLARLIGTGF